MDGTQSALVLPRSTLNLIQIKEALSYFGLNVERSVLIWALLNDTSENKLKNKIKSKLMKKKTKKKLKNHASAQKKKIQERVGTIDDTLFDWLILEGM